MIPGAFGYSEPEERHRHFFGEPWGKEAESHARSQELNALERRTAGLRACIEAGDQRESGLMAEGLADKLQEYKRLVA
jgi:hypothetical protein